VRHREQGGVGMRPKPSDQQFHALYCPLRHIKSGGWRIEMLGAASLCRLHQQRVRLVPVFDACARPTTPVLRISALFARVRRFFSPLFRPGVKPLSNPLPSTFNSRLSTAM